jgi:hypothetical protein
MPYKLIQDILFYKDGSSKDTTILKKGTIVKEADWSEMDSVDLASFRKIVKRHQARFPNERVGFFHFDGRIRSAVFGKSLVRSRRAL